MPIYNGNYVAPVWVNNVAPAINDTELLAMSGAIQASQVLTGSEHPTQYTGGVVGQRYADMSTSPPTIWKLETAADEANVWVPEDGAGNLAQEYADNTGYAEGDYCIHEGYLYRANTDITGEAWTAAHWTRAYAAEDLASHEQDQGNPHNVTAAQTGAVSSTVIAPTESSTTASQSYAVGKYFFLYGILYRVTAPIAQGDTITVGTNVALTALGDDVAAQKVKLGSITLSTTWTGASSPYSQTVTVTGVTVTAESQIELQPSPAQISALLSAGTRALQVENNNGTVTVYAIGTAPSSSLTIQCAVTNAGEGGGGGTIVPKSITANGTYNASSDNADGYSPVTVNVAADVLLNDHEYKTTSGGTFNFSRSVTIVVSGTYFVASHGYSSNLVMKINGVSQALSFYNTGDYSYWYEETLNLSSGDVLSIDVVSSGISAASAQVIRIA